MATKLLKRYKLSFTAPLHISNEREDYASGSSFIHSDTLYAALMYAWSCLGKESWIQKSAEEPIGFSISSLFPFYQDIYFLPRPLYNPAITYTQLEDTKTKKKIKKSTWVNTTIFEEILNDQEPTYHEKINFNDGFWSSEALPEKSFLISDVVPRSAVPSMPGEDTKIFYIERFYFDKEAGLYFLVQFDSDEDQQKFNAGLQYLSDEGFGTDRSIGNGKFTFSQSDASAFKLKNNHQLTMNLGLFSPQSKEQIHTMIAGEQVGYDLIKRGGWLSEPYQTWRKKNIYMFKEGSVFSRSNIEEVYSIMGQLNDLKPTNTPQAINHPIWRSGKTLFLNF